LMTWSLAVGTDLSGKEHLGTLAWILFVSKNLQRGGAFVSLLDIYDRTQPFLEKVDSTHFPLSKIRLVRQIVPHIYTIHES
jgi:hypothetical protein